MKHTIEKIRKTEPKPILKKSRNSCSKLLALTLLFLTFLFSGQLSAQTFPVEAQLRILQPHSPAFYTLGSPTGGVNSVNNIQLNLSLRDPRETSLNIGLQWEITNERGQYLSAPELSLQPITLIFGMPTMLSNSQLSTYFSEVSFPQGMLLDGYLPEGACEICVTAIELMNQTPVSRTTCAFLFLEELDPPDLVIPMDSIIPMFPQNVQVSWQPLHVGNFPIEYRLEIWEELPEMTPEQIINNTPPYLVKTVNQMNTVFISAIDPPLLVGQSYLMQVRARDVVNMGGFPPVYVFRNQGKSPFKRFKYGFAMPEIPCEPPVDFGYDLTEDLKTYLFWDGGSIPIDDGIYGTSSVATQTGQVGVDGNPSNSGTGIGSGMPTGFSSFYKVHWREKIETSDGSDWLFESTDQTQFHFDDYKRGRNYEIFVEKTCPSSLLYSDTIEIAFSMMPPERPYECGQLPLDHPSDNYTPLPALFIGDTLLAADVRVIITQTNGSNGQFSGEGYFHAPLLKSVKIAVEFDQIQVNDEYQLTSGAIITKFDETGSNIFNLDGLDNLFSSNDFSIPTVTFDDADSIVINENGQVVVYHGGDSTTFDQPVIVNSNLGDVVYSGGYAMPILDDFETPDGLLEDIRMTFEAPSDMFYGFDSYDAQIPDEYDQIDDYRVPYKSIGRGDSDVLLGNLRGPASIDSVSIITSMGAVLSTSVVNGSRILINTAGVHDEEAIYAMIPEGCIGVFYQKSYEYTNYHVHLVPVNGAGSNLSLTTLEEQVSGIMRQGVTQATLHWSLAQIQDDDPDGVIGAESRLMTAYSPDMDRIIRALNNYPGHEVDPVEFYIFLVDNLEGNVEGFMPQGMQYAFIDVSKVSTSRLAKVLTHELSHGIFTLEHYWIDYDKDELADNENLLDYSPEGTRLLLRQWDRMHNPRFPLPWLDGDGDAQFAEVPWLIPVEPNSDFPYAWQPFMYNASQTICHYLTESSAPLGCIPGIKEDLSCYLLSTVDGVYTHEMNGTSTMLPITRFDEFEDNDFVYLYEHTGICGDNKVYRTKWGYIKDKYGSFSFESDTSITFVSEIPCLDDTSSFHQKIEPLFKQVNPIDVNCPEEDFDLLVSTFSQKLIAAHQNAYGNISNYPYSEDTSTFRYVLGYTRMGEYYYGDESIARLEHHLAYLFEKTGTSYYVIFEPTNVTLANDNFNILTNRVLIESGLLDKIVLVTIPYTFAQSYPGSPDYGYIMPGIGSNYGETFEGLSDDLTAMSIYKVLLGIYASLEKPYHLYTGYLRYDGTTSFSSRDYGLRRGKPCINELALFYDKSNIDLISQKRTDFFSCIIVSNLGRLIGWTQDCTDKFQALLDANEFARDSNNRDFKEYDFKIRLKEHYFNDLIEDDGNFYANQYAVFEYGKIQSFFPDYYIDLFGENVPDQNALYSADVHQFFYDVADVVSIIGAPFGLDVIGEFAGLVAAQFDDDLDRRILNTAAYSVGMSTISVPAVAIKKATMGAGFLLMVNSKKVLFSFTRTDEVISVFTTRFSKTINRTVAQKVIDNPNLSKRLIENEYLLKTIGESPHTEKLLEDLADNPDLLVYLDRNLGGVEAWEIFVESADPGINILRTEVSSLQLFGEIVQNNNLGLNANGLRTILEAAANKGQTWDEPGKILDAVKRASEGNISGIVVDHKKFPVAANGNSGGYLVPAKLYQKAASGDANLSFEVGGRSFDNIAPDGKLVDRKFGHSNSIFDRVENEFGEVELVVSNESRIISLLNQAKGQIGAAGGHPIRWEISTSTGADGIGQVFNGLGGYTSLPQFQGVNFNSIEVKYEPLQ